MVYEKKRSGDPDYDDKQPPEFHAGQVVSAGDGVFITPQGGAVDVNGAHVNLAGTDDDGDNRPTPGNVAKYTSTTQDYQAEDTPAGTDAVEADKADVEKIRNAQAAMIKAGQDIANGTTPESTNSQSENPTADTAPAQTAPSSTKSTTAGKSSTK